MNEKLLWVIAYVTLAWLLILVMLSLTALTWQTLHVAGLMQ